MTAGLVQTVVVCAAAPVGQSPCASGMAPTTVSAYLVDPAQAANIDAQSQPFDYAVAASIWGFAFTFVVGLYLVSKSSGVILNAIKNF